MLDDGYLVYSVGSKNLFGFEVAVDTHLGCKTHTFDPKVKIFDGGKYADFNHEASSTMGSIRPLTGSNLPR